MNWHKYKKLSILIGIFLVLCVALLWVFILNPSLANTQLFLGAPFSNPPESLQVNDLVGTWQANYMEWGIDKLIIRSDDTFKQIYHDNPSDYVFESPWNPWHLEKLDNGGVYLHLVGGKYFLNGLDFSKNIEGDHFPCSDLKPPCDKGSITLPFTLYDWIEKKYIDSTGELILNVRKSSNGKLLLLHLWTSSDRGFPLIGGSSEIFRRIDAP